MKKFLSSIVLFFLIISTSVYAYSSGFLYMINAMNIETVNVNGLLLNEEIYEKYNILVYGSPIQIKDKNQRWKEISNGNWTLNGNAWNGTGVRGEYWILGEDYSGKLIHNEIFPDDYNSGTSPLNWNYREIKDAEESWNDISKYQYSIQRDYMLTQKLSRFGITYDITALDIGLNKARVENYATWRSAGSIYTEKPGTGNIYWAATFSVPPMAGDAKLNSILNLLNGNEYTIEKEETQIEIPIEFGAHVTNLSKYASAEHIKIIEAELKVNNVTNNIVSGTQTVKISETGNILINKSDYPNQDKVILEVECNSFLATCFTSDPMMYASKKATIIVNIENEEHKGPTIVNDDNAPKIYGCTIKRVSTDQKGREKIVDLYVSKKTGMQFICAGQVMKIEVRTSKAASGVSFDFSGKNSIRTLDDLTKRFEWEEPIARNEETRYLSLRELLEAYDLPRKLHLEEETEDEKIFSGIYVIPYNATQTLHSWNSLRAISKDAFSIDESKLFTRKEQPYRLVIRASSVNGIRTQTYKFDVAERWDELYNRDISEYVTNKK